ncbi:MAG: hypothetical protein QW098_04930 [Candidatus Hadarchaeales archaeon]
MDLPLYLLFGALTALLLASAFLFQLTAQAREAVDEQAWGLLEGLARSAFSLLPGEETRVNLPPSLGGCAYEFRVEGNVLRVRILDGVREGKLYSLELAEEVRVENSSFGGTVYLRREEGGLVLSSSPLPPLPSPSSFSPSSSLLPPFCSLARENPRVASALLLSFSLYGDPEGYAVRGESVAVRVGGSWLLVGGRETAEKVGAVENAWVVERVEEGSCGGAWEDCPSVGEAVSGGWALTPSQALSEFLGRAWRWENGVVEPENLTWRAAAVTTAVGSFPAYRFEFSSGGEDFVVYYRMLRWWYLENSPGFFMQSEPSLEPV